jgi:ribosomal peptide maturation radical SAM protein 1
MTRVLLINMPFAAIDSPSLALGLFKSRLQAEGIACDVQNLNLAFAERIGYENYEFVLRLSAILGGENLFAHTVFGNRLAPVRDYYREVLSTGSAGSDVPPRMEEIRSQVPAFLEWCLNAIPWQSYPIVGFTSLFEQNLSSLALARLVKNRYPATTIVFGGANCEAEMGRTLHECFPFVDLVCTGEADESFPELVQRLKYHHPIRGLRGVVHRESSTTMYAGAARTIENLDPLPIPDYDDYFQQLQASPLRYLVRPSLLIESARGCWWGEKSHCTFCGLNGLTMAFRTKSVPRTLEEITLLIARYNVRIVRFVDNILSPHYFRDLLPEIIRRGLKADYICEVKSNLKKNQIRTMAEAGLTVQAGIENLSSHVLNLMAKGSNALMNVQTLKWCKQYGVSSDWNLLYGFPGEVPDDYRKNLEMARVLTHLHPPTGCGPIRLDRFSPNFDDAERIGIRNIRPLKFYRHLYPFDEETLSKLVYYFDFDYAQKIDDGGFLPPLQTAVDHWKTSADKLFLQRTERGLVIHDSRPIATWTDTEVGATAALVYEYCDKVRSLPRIIEAMEERKVDNASEVVPQILEEFVRRGLMVREGQRYLSLAVMPYASEFEQQEEEAVSSSAKTTNPSLLTIELTTESAAV